MRDVIQRAWVDRSWRKALLKRYRWEVARPKLRIYDQQAFQRVAARILPAFGAPLSDFMPAPQRLSLELLVSDHMPVSALWFRVWALVRVTGRWPLVVWGMPDMPDVLPACAGCDASQVSVLHALCECPAGAGFFNELHTVVGPISRSAGAALFGLLFGPCPPPGSRGPAIAFVGRVISSAAASALALAGVADVTGELEPEQLAAFPSPSSEDSPRASEASSS